MTTAKAKDGSTVSLTGKSITSSTKTETTTIALSAIHTVSYKVHEGWATTHQLVITFGNETTNWDGASYVTSRGYRDWYFANKYADQVRLMHDAIQRAIS
ncbi:hypothetical protein [Microlunatus sp. GCM10028923]|uniref:hypothetical protein n=1 Tax=Microlunatus sp. GCM10028923 TaxID=3273400 RepID=UPI003612852B